jgi:hypothetical protein
MVKPSQLSPECGNVLKGMAAHYKDKEPEYDFDWDLFSTEYFVTLYPRLSKEEAIAHRAILTNAASLKEAAVSDTVLRSFVTREYAARIALAADKLYEDGAANLDDVSALVTEYETAEGKVDGSLRYRVGDDLKEFIETVSPSGGLEFRTEALNVSVGPAREGNLFIVGARPDSGKTGFVVAQLVNLLREAPLDRNVLFFSNEENPLLAKSRAMSLHFDMPLNTWTYLDDMEKLRYIEEDKYQVFKRFILFRSKPGDELTTKQMEGWIKDNPACAIAYDQLRKFKLSGKHIDSEVQTLMHLYGWARAMADYAPSFVMHQADGSGEGQMWLTQNQLQGSKTDIQGEADAIFMLGRSVDDPPGSNLRYLNIPKNKLGIGPKCDELHRNGKWVLEIKDGNDWITKGHYSS